MELPRGTTIKYQEEEDYDVDEVLEDIDGRFLGYIRIFGKTDSNTEDNYLLIKKGKIIAAESESDTKSIRGNESLNRMKEMKYKHAAIEFVAYEEEFKYEMALELNGHCQLTENTQTVQRSTSVGTTKKPSREELLKKYRIRAPSDESVVHLVGEKDTKIVQFEDKMKSELLKEVKKSLNSATLFMNVSLTEFEMFLREKILNCTVGVSARCIVQREDLKLQEEGKKLDQGLQKTIKETLERNIELAYKNKKIENEYKLSITLKNNLKLREAIALTTENYSAKNTL